MNESTVEFSSVTSEITIGKTVYGIAPLKMVDRAAVERRIRDKRMSCMLEELRGLPLPDEVIGTAIAKVACQAISLDELLDTYDSRIYMLWLSLHRGGTTMSEVQVADLPADIIKVLNEIVCHINHIKIKKGEDGAHPTTAINGKSTESEVATGTNS